VLGAILAPPDAIAATSIAERLGLPKRIVTILEGESLVNDASALIIYRAAIAAAATAGSAFSMMDLARDFVWVSLGGIVVGLVLGYLINRMVMWLCDTPVEILLTLMGSFAAYVIAEQFHLSGVLASVVLGVYLGRQSPRAMSAQSRVEGKVVWETLVFLINGTVFLLIGLQLPSVLTSLKADNMGNLFGYALAVSLAVVVLRFLWVFPATYLPRVLSRAVRERDPAPSWKYPLVIGWTGMRGIVSLAAALSLPLGFPYRDLILFLTFAVILTTLVGQGLSLPWLIGKLKLPKDTSHHREESWARLTAARAGLVKLEALEGEGWAHSGQVKLMRSRYNNLQERYSARFWGRVHQEQENNVESFNRLRFSLIEAELEALVEMRDNGTINDETLRQVQHELDLEWLRLERGEARE
jgi:monovalent cation/hydrogen antiporter